MIDNIVIEGIETNNLKNIDVEIVKKGINLIIGPSGSGKSSLAYDTIAQIGQHEFMAMFADEVSEPSIKSVHFQIWWPQFQLSSQTIITILDQRLGHILV